MKVTITYAQTLDGRIASRTGDSQWIGGPESLRLAHQLRATHDAVLVGVGTILADNPRLTTRLVDGASPLRVIADSTLRIPPGANVLQDDAAATLIVTTNRASDDQRARLRRSGADVAVAGRDADGRVDVEELVGLLAVRGIKSLLVEGGAGMITSFLRSRLCDRLVICVAPRILGKGIEAVGDLGITRLRDAMCCTDVRVTQCGEDLIVDAALAAVAVA